MFRSRLSSSQVDPLGALTIQESELVGAKWVALDSFESELHKVPHFQCALPPPRPCALRLAPISAAAGGGGYGLNPKPHGRCRLAMAPRFRFRDEAPPPRLGAWGQFQSRAPAYVEYMSALCSICPRMVRVCVGCVRMLQGLWMCTNGLNERAPAWGRPTGQGRCGATCTRCASHGREVRRS